MKRTLFGLLFCFILSGFSCKVNNRVTPYEYALLSAHVYNDGTKTLPTDFETIISYEEKEKSFTDHLGGFLNSLDMDRVLDLSDKDEKGELIAYLAMKAVASGGYYGQAYIDKSTGQLIIAHRGTDNLINTFVEDDKLDKDFGQRILALVRDLDDDYEIFSGKIPREQYYEARAFSKKAKKTYREQFNKEPEVVHTGHSLGAVLAELCAIEENSKAITFESPGSGPLIKELSEITYNSDFDYKKFDPSKVDITTYNARPNRINTLHQHVGKVIPLYRESKVQKVYSDDLLFENISGHAIDSLLTRFDKRTGNPKKN